MISGRLGQLLSDARLQWVARTLSVLPAEMVRAVRWTGGVSDMPRRHQRLYVRPESIEFRLRPARALLRPLNGVLGKVAIPGDWDLDRKPLGGAKRTALLALARGSGPVGSGYCDWMMGQATTTRSNHGCRTPEDIARRAERLEEMIAEIRATGRLLERREIERWVFRERGGIQVAVARDGCIMKAWEGDHRLTFAQAIGIGAIPVSLVAIHPHAMVNGAWERLVQESHQLAPQGRSEKGGDVERT